MPRQLITETPLRKCGLMDGFWFYENQESGLGDYFMDSMYAELGALRLYAGIHVRRFDFHRAIAKRFPYSIYYEVEEGQFVVICGCLLDGLRADCVLACPLCVVR